MASLSTPSNDSNRQEHWAHFTQSTPELNYGVEYDLGSGQILAQLGIKDNPIEFSDDYKARIAALEIPMTTNEVAVDDQGHK